MKKIILLIYTFTLMCLSVYANNSYSPIYPTTVQINIGKGKKVGEFKIFNTGDKIKTFEVAIKNTDNSGAVSQIKDYLKVFPKSFSLKPGETKTIRVMLRDFPKELMGKGELKGSLLIKGLSSKIENQYESKDQKGITATVDIKIDVSMAIYVLTGNEKSGIEILSKKSGANKTVLELKNIGNYSYEVLVEAYDKKGKVIEGGYPMKIVSGESQKFGIASDSISKIKMYEFKDEKKLNLLLEKSY